MTAETTDKLRIATPFSLLPFDKKVSHYRLQFLCQTLCLIWHVKGT